MSVVKRQSNMELLRIVSMFLIIIFHCCFKSGFAFDEAFTANKLIVKTGWMFGELGVDLFMLISGYFLIDGRFKPKKLALLVGEVGFYHVVTFIFASFLGIYTFSKLRKIFGFLFPIIKNYYWFITVYIIIYILSPYLNLFLKSLSAASYRKLLIILLTLYSVIPTFFGIFFNSTEGMLYYNRLIWLTVVYFIGAYIKLHRPAFFDSVKAISVTGISAAAVLVLSIVLIDRFQSLFARLGTSEIAYFWPPNTVPMVLLSVSVFGAFLNLKLPYSPVINRIASTTLGIYMLHDGVLTSWIWRTVFRCADYASGGGTAICLVLRILAASIIIFAVGMVIDLLRQLLEKYTLKRFLDSKWLAGILRRRKKIKGD